MSTAATIPFTASRSSSEPWSPSDRDRVIFQWVKFDGHKQSWVAEQLGLHQSSVSRIVERYERWIARGGPSHQGSPNHEERLRAQRWLTYERNEWLLASALRLAGEMERSLDTSKSHITHHTSDPTREIEVRTEHKVLDRSGTACRFLRLAHRINMDQLKLIEQDPLPPLEPLSITESGDDLLPTLADTPDIASTAPTEQDVGWAVPTTPASGDRANEGSSPAASSNGHSELGLSFAPFSLTAHAEPMHQTHTADQPQPLLTHFASSDSDDDQLAEKIIVHAYAVGDSPPETTGLPQVTDIAILVTNHQTCPCDTS